MKRHLAVGLVFTLSLLLVLSVVGNICQLCRISVLNDILSGDDIEVVDDVAEAVEPLPITPEPSEMPQPVSTSVADKNEEKSTLPALTLQRARADAEFDVDGYAFCKKLVLEIKDLQAENSSEILKKITVMPQPKSVERIYAEQGRLIINGRFECGKEYLVTLPAGIRSGSTTTSAETTYIVNTKKPRRVLGFHEAGTYYPVAVKDGKVGKCTVAVDTFDIENIMVSIYRLPNENMDVGGVIAEHSYDGNAKSIMHKIAEKILAVKAKPNHRELVELDITAMLEEAEAGLYAIELSDVNEDGQWRDGWWNRDGNPRLTLVLSRLGISAVHSESSRNLAFCVRELDSLKAVTGAKVRVYTGKHILLGEATTAEDGTARVNYSAVPGKLVGAPAFVIAEKEEDFSILHIGGNSQLSNAEFNNDGRSFQKCNALVYTERGIYRPGEEIHASAIVRANEDGLWHAKSLPCEFCLKDASGNVVGRNAATTNSDGFAVTFFKLDKLAPSGIYTLSCGIAGETPWNSCSLNVGAFTPNRIKVEATSRQEFIAEGETLHFNVQAQFYFGKPLEHGRIMCKLYDMGAARAEHWKDYAVGMPDCDGEGLFLGELPAYYYDNFTEETFDIEGIYALLKEKNVNMTLPRKLRVVAEVTEAGERTVSDAASVTLNAHPIYLGMRYVNSSERRASIECRLFGLTRNDDEKSTIEASATLRRKEWRYLLCGENGTATREWREVTVQEERVPEPLKFTSEGTLLPLKELDYGHYELEANNGNGVVTILDFWHWYGDGGSVRSSNPAVLTVQADAERYAPGSIAQIKFTGRKGALLIAAGEQNLTDLRCIDTVSGENSIQLPIPANVMGNAYFAELSLIELDEAGNAVRRYALLRIPVTQEHHKMELTLQTADKAEPGSPLQIEISAADKKGEPVDGTLQLFAVDEGILALTDYQVPDALDFFHGKYYCDFMTYDLYSSIFPRQSMTAPRKIGGGDGLSGLRLDKMREKESAAIVLPPVKLEHGKAHVTMRLPRHTGAMRIMAVAVSQKHFGAVSKNLTMLDAAGVEASIPAVAAPKDTFTAVFNLFNHEIDDGTAVLKVQSETGLPIIGDSVHKLNLLKGKSAQVSLNFRAEKEGAHEVAYILNIGGKNIEGKEYVNVRASNAAESRVVLKRLSAGEQFKIEDNGWQKLLEREVTVSPSPAVAARMSLNWLNEYPYGCLEQTTACAFPFLALGNLEKSGIITSAMLPAYAGKVEAAVMRILTMRRGSRGFAMWPDSNTIWGEGGLFAAHFLILSKSSALSKNALQEMAQFLQNYMENTEVPFNRAYAAYVLALMEDDFGAKRILQQPAKYQKKGMAQFMCGAALIKAGYASKGVPLVKAALDGEAWRDGKAGFCISGEDACKAITLSIGMDIVPEHPAMTKLAMELAAGIRSDGSAYGTTGANAWCTFGLAAFGAHYGVSPAEIELEEGGKIVRRKIVCSENLKDVSKVRNVGSGPLFVMSKERGIPKEGRTAGKIKLNKVYLNEKGDNVSAVKCGDLLTVKITMEYAAPISNAVLLDLLPGGFEIENGELASRNGIVLGGNSGYNLQHCEMLQDRYLMFCETAGGTCIFSYNIRAVNPGIYAIPSTTLQNMYEPDCNGSFAAQAQLKIED